MSELTLHQKQMKALDDENQKLTGKLKLVRSIMRENKIGHLYPGATPEHEDEVKTAAVDDDNYYALQRVAWHNGAESEGWKRVVHNVHLWLQTNFPETVLEMPEGLFNPIIAMDFDVKKFLVDKKGETIGTKYSEIKGVISNG